MRILLIAAIVLIAFAIIATASATGTCLGVGWATWLSASLLAYFADLLLGWTFSPGR
jgi:ABC-type multidrug transport system permease subunit